MVDGKTRILGVIGDPIEHTFSPAMHNAGLNELGLNYIYLPFHVKEDMLGECILGAKAMGIKGLNVTIPHKTNVIKHLDDIDSVALMIGAVNTIQFNFNENNESSNQDNEINVRTKGFNTDGYGCVRAIKEKTSINNKKVTITGAGGAARAVAFLCAEKGAKKVYLLNRSIEKAQAVAAEVNRAFAGEVICPMIISDYQKLPEEKLLAIQCTSVGLHPDTDRAVIEDEVFYQKIHTGYDLIYKPAETKFMKYVTKNGGRAYNGLKMLLYQGIIAYELWNDVTVSADIAEEIYGILKDRVAV